MAYHLKPSAAGFRSLTSAARSSPLKSPRSSSFHTAPSPIPRISRTTPTSTSFPLRNQTPNALAITTARHASSSAPISNQPDIPKDVLTWDRFFGLRRTRRYVNLGASVITGGGALLVLGPVLAQQDIDAWAAQVSGLDPMMVLGITGIAIAAGGWLCGPTFGNGAFKIWAARKGWNHSIAEVSGRQHLSPIVVCFND